GTADDRLPAALQQRLPRRHDELRVRDRAGPVGAGCLDLAARARHAPAACGIDAVRAGTVLLSPVFGWALRPRRALVRAAASVAAIFTPAPVLEPFQPGSDAAAVRRFCRQWAAVHASAASVDDD